MTNGSVVALLSWVPPWLSAAKVRLSAPASAMTSVTLDVPSVIVTVLPLTTGVVCPANDRPARSITSPALNPETVLVKSAGPSTRSKAAAPGAKAMTALPAAPALANSSVPVSRVATPVNPAAEPPRRSVPAPDWTIAPLPLSTPKNPALVFAVSV
jgi:hypothetical protein